jgi:hypothetical protein
MALAPARDDHLVDASRRQFAPPQTLLSGTFRMAPLLNLPDGAVSEMEAVAAVISQIMIYIYI